ncbi:hypothetical protein [Microbacterium sp. C7(2022)]|uniref:hypothetical protein n=1 Tax=Microbacterium sp. C7(2022) TaxID=2992759 RepID=UPI00237B836B|nr:hypothetical protein [Microbacterium sp. C7(2022)]MDE0547558.1 hypothetical protein [Microbacterium sp. C7(2022)]
MKMTYRTALTISAEVEGQASGDRVEGDPRGILAALERIWEVIDGARRAQKPRGGELADDAPFEVAIEPADLPFILQRLEEGNAVELEILAEENLHPQTRREQEESLDLGRSAVAEVRRLIAEAKMDG